MIKINIIRGQNQIGGSIIEVATETTRIILDAGSELDEEVPAIPNISGLFCDEPAYDAVLITHYHGDHIGLLDKVLPEIPVFIGKKACDVTAAARFYRKKPPYRADGFYESGKPFTIGDITITPYLCDHSAYDSYMLHVSCGGESLLYTGDFRSNGRKNFSALLSKLPHADTLICEGTTLTRILSTPQTEVELEQEMAKAIKCVEGPVFVNLASTNIDRLVTVFKAARQNRRVLLMDLYTALISSAAGESIPNPKTFAGVRAFLTHSYKKDESLYKAFDEFGKAKIGRDAIAKERFVMCVRSSMQDYLQGLSETVSFEGGLFIYSMWEGYKKKENLSSFIEFMESKGVKTVSIHTSGHADAATIDALVKKVNPSKIIPVHTENAAWFERYKKSVAP